MSSTSISSSESFRRGRTPARHPEEGVGEVEVMDLHGGSRRRPGRCARSSAAVVLVRVPAGKVLAELDPCAEEIAGRVELLGTPESRDGSGAGSRPGTSPFSSTSRVSSSTPVEAVRDRLLDEEVAPGAPRRARRGRAGGRVRDEDRVRGVGERLIEVVEGRIVGRARPTSARPRPVGPGSPGLARRTRYAVSSRSSPSSVRRLRACRCPIEPRPATRIFTARRGRARPPRRRPRGPRPRRAPRVGSGARLARTRPPEPSPAWPLQRRRIAIRVGHVAGRARAATPGSAAVGQRFALVVATGEKTCSTSSFGRSRPPSAWPRRTGSRSSSPPAGPGRRRRCRGRRATSTRGRPRRGAPRRS